MRFLQSHLTERVLATSGVHVSVREEPGPCPVCGGPMCVRKTIPDRRVQTLEHGSFRLDETVHACAARCRRLDGTLVIRRASAPAKFLIPGRSVGYDVMVWVGFQRFLHHRQREEIRSDLYGKYGIRLSTGEISILMRLFLDYVRRLHEACSLRLWLALVEDGGWPLHIDATCEDGRGTLLAILAGWRGWALGAWKIPTESAEAIIECMRLVVCRFGAPCAMMRDMGPAVTFACEQLVADLDLTIKILSCHRHVLADIGRDLLKPGHNELLKIFRSSKIRSALRTLARDLSRELGGDLNSAREQFQAWLREEPSLHVLPAGEAGIAVVRGFAQWSFDFMADAEYRDFPFDQPYLYFYDRCVQVRRAVDGYLRRPPEDRRVLMLLKRMGRILDPALQDPKFVRTARDLRERANLFNEMRKTMRLHPKIDGRRQPHPKRRLTPRQAAAELRDIRASLKRFAASLRKRRPQRGPGQNLRAAIDIILRHLKVHGRSLWGHDIRLPARAGGGIRLVDRTNNLSENSFRGMKQGERRRSGRKNLAQDFENLPPESALVRNFKFPDYVAIVCGSPDRLPHIFAKMDAVERRKRATRSKAKRPAVPTPTPMIETASLPTIDRRLIRSEDMRRRLDDVVRSRPPHVPLARPSTPSPTA